MTGPLDLRLAVPAAIGWIVLIVVLGAPDALVPIAIGAGASAVGILLFGVLVARIRRGIGVVAIALVVIALLLGSAAARAPARQPTDLIEAAEAGRRVAVELVVTQSVLPGERSFEGRIVSVRVGGAAASVVSIPVRVFGDDVPAMRLGSRATAAGELRANPPADASAFLVFASGRIEVVANPGALLGTADDLRAGFRSLAESLPGDGGALLPGLAIGDDSAVPDDLDAAMTGSSLSHLTAVSGANCAVIVALILLLGARVGLSRGARIIAAALALLGFVVLVTPEPSVLRAATMALLVLVAIASGRPVSGLPILALATIGLLVVDPWLARSYGFVLSVLATAGLLLLAGPLARVLQRWLPPPVALVIAVPVAAQLACQPVLLLLEPTIPLYGVVANVLAEPAAPVATVLGLIACLVAPLSTGLAQLLVGVAWLPAAWISAVARAASSAPGAAQPWLAGPSGVVLLAAITVAALLAVLAHGRVRVVSSAALALVFAVQLGAAGGSAVHTALTRPQDWRFAACDVGQGDAVLVRDGGRVALIDTGPDPEALHGCLDDLGVARLDLVVLTHFDLDHVGGVAAVLGRTAGVVHGPPASAADRELLDELTRRGAALHLAEPGMTGLLGGLEWRVLWPPPRGYGAEPGNDASVAMLVEPGAHCSGCLSALFLGDLGAFAQRRLLASTRLPPVDVVKVAHHGSADQDPELYTRVQATVGLIGVGADNTYGHPTDALLELLRSARTSAERTDLQGLVLVGAADDGALFVWSERGG